MRNEMSSLLKELHRVVQRSCFFLMRDQRSLRLLEAGESRRMLSSQITDTLKLGAHPVGRSTVQVIFQLALVILLSLTRSSEMHC